jgi:hypothetical protein
VNPAIIGKIVIPVRQTTQAGEGRNRFSDRHHDLCRDPPVNRRIPLLAIALRMSARSSTS